MSYINFMASTQVGLTMLAPHSHPITRTHPFNHFTTLFFSIPHFTHLLHFLFSNLGDLAKSELNALFFHLLFRPRKINHYLHLLLVLLVPLLHLQERKIKSQLQHNEDTESDIDAKLLLQEHLHKKTRQFHNTKVVTLKE